jgi:hypothetical protein
MIHTPRQSTQPPLCVVRREVAEHFAAIDRAERDLRVSCISFRSVERSLSDRMMEIRRRLDAAHSHLKATGSPIAVRAAAFDVNDALPVRPRARREGSRSAVQRSHLAGSPRQPRLRLYSPTSPV